MEHLDDITVAELQAALDAVDGKKPTQRLLAAIAYKNGITQTELAEWHGVQRRTIYNWLKRLDADSLEAAVEDAHRPGRPRRLSERQQNELNSTLRESPVDAGYDESEWTPELVQRFVKERFDVDYSRPSCRRFMREVRS